MDAIARTRMNLLLLRRQIEVGERGLELLRSKREALVAELFRIMDRVVESRRDMEVATGQALASLALALGMEGRGTVCSAGYAGQRTLPVELIERNVWGVRFPELRHAPVVRTAQARGCSLTGLASYLDEAARRFEIVLELALRSVAVEMRLKKLGAEIRKSTRRINALDKVLIPRLRREARQIRQDLEQHEREDLFRMKRFKSRGSSDRRTLRGSDALRIER